jgi:hypothetical protein
MSRDSGTRPARGCGPSGFSCRSRLTLHARSAPAQLGDEPCPRRSNGRNEGRSATGRVARCAVTGNGSGRRAATRAALRTCLINLERWAGGLEADRTSSLTYTLHCRAPDQADQGGPSRIRGFPGVPLRTWRREQRLVESLHARGAYRTEGTDPSTGTHAGNPATGGPDPSTPGTGLISTDLDPALVRRWLSLWTAAPNCWPQTIRMATGRPPTGPAVPVRMDCISPGCRGRVAGPIAADAPRIENTPSPAPGVT